MAIDSASKRASAAGLKPFKKVIIPDGLLSSSDWIQIASLYSGIAVQGRADALELEVGTDVLLLESGDALLLELSVLYITLVDTITIADSFSYERGLFKVLSDTIGITDAYTKAIGLIKGDTVTITDALVKAIGLIKGDTVTIADSIVKAVGLIKSDTITITDSIVKAISLIFADTITIADSWVVRLIVSIVAKTRWRFPTKYTDPTSRISGYEDPTKPISGYEDPKTRWKFPSDYE